MKTGNNVIYFIHSYQGCVGSLTGGCGYALVRESQGRSGKPKGFGDIIDTGLRLVCCDRPVHLGHDNIKLCMAVDYFANHGTFFSGNSETLSGLLKSILPKRPSLQVRV